MIRVGQDDLRAGRRDVIGKQPLDRALSADRHECRRVEGAVSRGHSPETSARSRIRRAQFKFQWRIAHELVVSSFYVQRRSFAFVGGAGIVTMLLEHPFNQVRAVDGQIDAIVPDAEEMRDPRIPTVLADLAAHLF